MPGLWNIFEMVLTFGGLFLVYYGRQNNIPLMLYLGIYMFAFGLIITGIMVIRTQRFVQFNRQTRMRRTFSGPTAMAIGMAMILFAAVLMVGGYFLMAGREDEMIAFVNNRPGLIVLAFGILAILFGVAAFIGNRQARESTGRFVMSIPGRIIGALLTLVGIGLTLMGMWAINQPAAFNEFWNSVVLGGQFNLP